VGAGEAVNLILDALVVLAPVGIAAVRRRVADDLGPLDGVVCGVLERGRRGRRSREDGVARA
jgi:hypothetical protein